jgi:rubredoxin
VEFAIDGECEIRDGVEASLREMNRGDGGASSIGGFRLTCQNTPLPIEGCSAGRIMKSYMCVICGYVYDEAQGVPEEGIAPGTKWEDVPDTWVCPDCGARKEDFEMVEI